MSQAGWILSLATAIVALYGAALSTYSVVAARRDKKRRVFVSLSPGVIGFANQPSASVVFIQAANPGDRAVTLQPGTIELPKGDHIFPPQSHSNVTFPFELPEGKSCSCWIETADLARLLAEQGYRGRVKLVGCFRSAVGTEYRSKPIKFRVEEWLKAS